MYMHSMNLKCSEKAAWYNSHNKNHNNNSVQVPLFAKFNIVIYSGDTAITSDNLTFTAAIFWPYHNKMNVSGFHGNDITTNTTLLRLILYDWIYRLSLGLAFLENKILNKQI
jgi:hypothetical protein